MFITYFLTTALIFLTPLFFLPFTPDFFTTNKQFLVILITLGLLAATAYSHLTKKKHQHSSTLALPLGIFVVALITNIILTREGRTESIIGGGALLMALSAVAYLISSLKPAKLLKWTLLSIVTAGTALALYGILQLVVFADLASLPIWMQTPFFSPAGPILNLLTIFAVSIVTTLTLGFAEKELTPKTILFSALGVQLAAVVAYIFVITQKEIQISILPIAAGWSMTLDALKSGKELFFGIGLANFSLLFTQTKPAFLAQSDLWLSVFQKSSNEFFWLLATTGLAGVISLGLVIITSLKASLRLPTNGQTRALRLAFMTLVLSLFLLPASTITYTWLFILMGVIAAGQTEKRRSITLSHYAPLISAGVLGAIIVASGYLSYRAYAAERAMFQTQLGIQENNAQKVYDAQTTAIRLMPNIASYRASFSQINLTLASSLSQAQGAQKDQLEGADQKPTAITDQQREQISTLVQRAIDQGKIATQLRPGLFTTWQNLGNIYRNLINVSDNAESFAVQYLNQAVTLYPNDPNLRIELGGLYYQLAGLVEDKETQQNLLGQAVQQFQVSVKLRPSFANGYYNLSKALEAQGQFRLAYQALSQTLANLEPDSNDYQTAQTELLALEKKLPQAPAAPTAATTKSSAPTTLQEPKPLPTPLPGGPIELPTSPGGGSPGGGMEELIDSPPVDETQNTPEETPAE